MMNNEINFLFNTHKVYKDLISDIDHSQIKNIIFKNDNMIVYLKNNFEVIVDKSGPVYISCGTGFKPEFSFEHFISEAIVEYNKLQELNNKFESNFPFKIIMPKMMSNSIKSSLDNLDLKYRYNEMKKEDSIIVYTQ